MRSIDPKRFKNVPFLYPTLDPLFQVSFTRAPGDPKDDPETNIHKYGCRFMCEMAMCQFISKRKLKKVDILDIYHKATTGQLGPDVLGRDCTVGGNEELLMKYALQTLGNKKNTIRQVMVKAVNARTADGKPEQDYNIKEWYSSNKTPGPNNVYFVIVDFNTNSGADYGGHHFVLFNAIGELIYDPANGTVHSYRNVNRCLFYKVFNV